MIMRTDGTHGIAHARSRPNAARGPRRDVRIAVMQFNLNGIVRSGGTAHPGAPENPVSPTFMPLPNVQVRLFDAGLSDPIDQSITDENGRFHLQAFHYGASS